MSIPGLTPRIRGYLRRYRRYLLIGFVLTLASTTCRMIWPRVLRQVINQLEPAASVESVAAFAENLSEGPDRKRLQDLLDIAPPELPRSQLQELADEFIDAENANKLRSFSANLRSSLTTGVLLRDCALIISLSLGAALLLFFMRWTLIRISRWIEYDLRADFFRHLQTLSPAFYQQNPTGDVMARLTNDLSSVRQMVGPGIMYSLNASVTLIAAITMMALIDVPTTLAGLLPVLLLTFLVNRLTRVLYRRSMAVQEQFATISTKAQESLAGIRVVKAYARADEEIREFGELNNDYLGRSMSLARITSVTFPAFALSANLGVLGVLSVGGYRVATGVLDVGGLLAFVVYLGMMIFPMGAFGWVLNAIQRGMAGLDRIEAYFQREPMITDPPTPVVPDEIRGEIELRGVSFRYPTSNGNGPPWALREISLHVPAGGSLAIVGRTGSGKSTLAQLPLRLYPLDEGQILIDGVDIKNWPLRDLRQSIGYVSQEPFLFSESIRDNILLGVDEAPAEDVDRVVKTARLAQDLPDFADGLDTLMGERGVTLSGGQKQRTALARALLVNPPILILDDAFASVDTRTEEMILRNLRDVIRTRTTILISHRISTVRDADWIVVLDEGHIIEEGTHNTLVQRGGFYADLYRRQLIEEDIDRTE
jgi:ATP-binding cassette subfamily B multidrug efflux pump